MSDILIATHTGATTESNMRRGSRFAITLVKRDRVAAVAVFANDGDLECYLGTLESKNGWRLGNLRHVDIKQLPKCIFSTPSSQVEKLEDALKKAGHTVRVITR